MSGRHRRRGARDEDGDWTAPRPRAVRPIQSGAQHCACGHNLASHAGREACDVCSCIWFHAGAAHAVRPIRPPAPSEVRPRKRAASTSGARNRPSGIPRPRAAGRSRGAVSYEVGKSALFYGAQETAYEERLRAEAQRRRKTSPGTGGSSRPGPHRASSILGRPCARCGLLMRAQEALRFDHEATGQWAHARCLAGGRRSRA